MVLLGPGCKFVRGEPIEARVGSVEIVVGPPVFDDLSGVPVAGEQVLIEGHFTLAHDARIRIIEE